MSEQQPLVWLIFLGALSGMFLTFMDRIDEHNLISGKYKTPLAYITGALSAVTSIIAMEILSELIVILFSLCIYWIIKNKLEYPSHVAFVFIMGIYFGIQNEYLVNNKVFIVINIIIICIVGIFMKKIISKESKLGKIFYRTYASKIFEDILISLILFQPLILTFTIPYAYSCLYIKKYFPGTK